MSEFHIGDPVVIIKTGESFRVMGVMRNSITERLLYCGEKVGWTSEEELDHDLTAEQRLAQEPVEHLLHSLRDAAVSLQDALQGLRKQNFGHVPGKIAEELQAIARLIPGADVKQARAPGALEVSDIRELLKAGRQLQRALLDRWELVSRSTEIVHRSREFGERLQIVEEFLR